MGLVGSVVFFRPVNGNGDGLLFRVDGLLQDAAFPVFTDEACVPCFLAADDGQVCGNVPAVALLRVQFHRLILLVMLVRPQNAHETRNGSNGADDAQNQIDVHFVLAPMKRVCYNGRKGRGLRPCPRVMVTA